MIAAWMLLATLGSGLLALAAILIERAARALRRPTRFVWLGAIAVALSLSTHQLLLVIDSASRREVASRSDIAGPTSIATTVGSVTTSSAGHAARAGLIVDVVSVPRWLSALDMPLMVLWFAGSTIWAAILAVSAGRLRRQSRSWRDAMIEGSAIQVSEEVGPALFGITQYRIVVPEWALRLDATQQRMILEHEQEHARVGDPALLLTGAVLVLLQPWNPVVWLLYRRLRFAIEADCDARVLVRAADVRAYGELLLDVGARAPNRLAPIVALSEAHSILERRISLMTRSPIARPGLRSAAALAAAGILFFAACQVPRPVASPTPPSTNGSPRLTTASGAESRISGTAAADSGRAIVKLTSLGLDGVGFPLTVLVFADGPARVGIGTAAPGALTDTLHLSSLPAMTMDVTEADVHLRLVGVGRMSVSGDVTGGRASHFSATAQEIIVLKGGVGVRTRGM